MVRRNVVRIAVRRAAHLRTPTLIVLAAIDNLVKGAAGQAVQNANLLLGLGRDGGAAAMRVTNRMGRAPPAASS